MLLLISWCIWTAFDAEADFSLLTRVHDLRDSFAGFIRGLRGKPSEPGLGMGDTGGGDGQSRVGVRSLSENLNETLNRFQSRSARTPTPPTVNPTGSSGYAPPDATAVEMGEITGQASRGAV